MPRYIVTEVRQYAERWLVEAASPEEAESLRGTTLDHDDGKGNDTVQSIEVEAVANDQEELPS